MHRNTVYEAHVAQVRQYAFQLAHLIADPLIAGWLDAERVEAFVADELDQLDPFTARIALAEADWLERVHAVQIN